MILWPALILGFLGGFHCLGMCGPIALALPVHNKGTFYKIISIFSYNLGRIVTYALFGILFGALGQSFVFFGFQQALSVILGVIILLFLVFSYFGKTGNGWLSKMSGYVNVIKSKLGALLYSRKAGSFLFVGMLNGLLPCGLVYMAAAGAVATGSVMSGVLFMVLFGLGTLPFMFSVSYYSHLISVTLRNKIRKAVPVFVGLMAVLLILRGLNLGINYISPKLSNECTEKCVTVKTLKCCHK